LGVKYFKSLAIGFFFLAINKNDEEKHQEDNWYNYFSSFTYFFHPKTPQQLNLSIKK